VLFHRESLDYGERIDSFLEALLQKECGPDSGSGAGGGDSAWERDG
jgi:hypothetical protein